MGNRIQSDLNDADSQTTLKSKETMAEEKSLSERIKENVLNPKSAEIDGQRVEQHSLKDQLQADAYFEAKAAVKRRGSGLKITKLQHSGGA